MVVELTAAQDIERDIAPGREGKPCRAFSHHAAKFSRRGFCSAESGVDIEANHERRPVQVKSGLQGFSTGQGVETVGTAGDHRRHT